jgi:hypothetical protein
MSFRNISIELTNHLDKQTKQSQGIFFTPKEARDRVLDIIKSVYPNPNTILEPCFGSGEFLEDIYSTFPSAVITGVELNQTLFNSSSRPNIYNMDFLEYIGKHDVIIGNPPYFVMKKTKDTELCQTGRPNMFVQFLYKAITTNLNKHGILAFVLPTSFFNCSYYERMRHWLYSNVSILKVELLSGSYIETQQDTFLLVIRNTQPIKEQPFFFRIGVDNIYLTPNYKELPNLIKGTSTLSQLGCSVKTGDVVWNQEKDKLSDTGTLLIYSSNISTGNLVLGNLKLPKKQYITGFNRSPLSGKAILLNRGYGNSKYKLNPVLIEQDSFYCENHINVIRGESDILSKVMKSLKDSRTQQFIDLFVGNGALSKSEIEWCLPIWLN